MSNKLPPMGSPDWNKNTPADLAARDFRNKKRYAGEDMTDDLVTRLRVWDKEDGFEGSVLTEAADEIERLRAKRDALQLTLAAFDHLFHDDGSPRTCYEYDDDQAAWDAMAATRRAALREKT